MVINIARKRKSTMELPKTIRYSGYLQIVDIEKDLHRLNLLINITLELRKL